MFNFIKNLAADAVKTLDVKSQRLLWTYGSLSILAVILSVVMSLAINSWRIGFHDAIQTYDSAAFWASIWKFLGLAFVAIAGYAVQTLFQRRFEFILREALFIHLGTLAEQSKASLKDQRLTEDTRQFAEITVSLGLGSLDAVLKLLVFSVVIVNSSSWFVFGLLLLWAAVGTVLSRLVSKPLVRLDYQQEQLEGQLRRDVIKYYDAPSKTKIRPSMTAVRENLFTLSTKLKNLALFQASFSQFTVIIPFLILAPAYFTKGMSLGQLWQLVDAMGIVLFSLSFIIDRRDSLTRLQAVVTRLKEIV